MGIKERAMSIEVEPSRKIIAKTNKEQVLQVIKKSKEGLSVDDICKKAHFSKKTVKDILYRACKNSKIERVGSGFYRSL